MIRKMTMRILILLLPSVFLFNYVNTETKMIVTYGEPDSVKYTKKNSTVTWDECIQLCLQSQECIMVWESDETCYIFDYYAISSVSQTDSNYGSIVAWKVEVPDDQCPTGTNPPTFNNQNATGTLFVDYDPMEWPMYVNYNIYLEGSKWKMSYSVNRSCSGNFMDIVNHKDGSGLCVTEWFSSDDGQFSFNRGLQLCQNKSALLASLVYPEDFAWFENDVKTNVRSDLVEPDTYARIDGKRLTACQSTPNTTECMSPAGFQFVGTRPPHFDSYKWVTNSSAMATPDDNCLVVVFKGNEPARVDVRGCSDSTSPLKTRLVFCSSSAWQYDAIDYD